MVCLNSCLPSESPVWQENLMSDDREFFSILGMGLATFTVVDVVVGVVVVGVVVGVVADV